MDFIHERINLAQRRLGVVPIRPCEIFELEIVHVGKRVPDGFGRLLRRAEGE